MSAVLYDVPGPRARRRQLIGTVIGAVIIVALLIGIGLKLYAEDQFTARMWKPFMRETIWRALGEGYVATLKPAGAAIALALLLGMVLAAGRLSDHAWLRWPVGAVIEFFRAIPLLMLILFLFLGYSDKLGLFGCLVVGLAIYNGCVLAEIFRAGIRAVPPGQAEAAYALGLRKSQVMRLVLLPQSVRIMLPAIISQCVVALKDTALGFVIGYFELLRTGRAIYTSSRNILPTLIVVALMYIVTCFVLSRLAEVLERRQRRVVAVGQAEAKADA